MPGEREFQNAKSAEDKIENIRFSREDDPVGLALLAAE